MQPRQTPKWLSLFITAFGPHGLVALAWWLGALHVERIRAKHRSYPFLELTGSAGAGKSTLMSVLWKLIGNNQPMHISSQVSLRRTMHQSVTGPLVLEEVDREQSHQANPFDWDVLKALYADPAIATEQLDQPLEERKYRGALVVLANPPLSDAIRSRFVIIVLERLLHTEESAQALRHLLDMLCTGDVDFYETASAAGERLEGLLQHTVAYYSAGEPHHSERVTFNHAQLHALLGVLDDLFVLPTDAREDAHIEVAAMTLITD